jgi:hypothetical protein
MACSADHQRRFSCHRYRVPSQSSWHMRIQERLKAKALQRVTIIPIQLRTQLIRQAPGNRSQSDQVDFLIAQPRQVKQQADGIRKILTIGLIDTVDKNPSAAWDKHQRCKDQLTNFVSKTGACRWILSRIGRGIARLWKEMAIDSTHEAVF